MTEQILCPVHQVAAERVHLREDGTMELDCYLCTASRRGPVRRFTRAAERLQRMAEMGVRVGGRTGAGA